MAAPAGAAAPNGAELGCVPTACPACPSVLLSVAGLTDFWILRFSGSLVLGLSYSRIPGLSVFLDL